jgi:hypothetical protein
VFGITNGKGMLKNPIKQQQKRKTQEEVVAILADKYHVSERYVQMVISGDRDHKEILEDYLFYKQEHNLLLQEVKKVIPPIN